LKNKFIITISDVHGSRQYTLSTLLKKLLLWLIILVVVVIWGSYSLSQYLLEKLELIKQQKRELLIHQEELKKQIKSIQQEKLQLLLINEELQEKQKKLLQRNNELIGSIRKQQEALASLNEKIKEVEEILGVESKEGEGNVSTSDATILLSKLDHLKETGKQKLENVKRLSPAEKRLLLRTIPNGPVVSYKYRSAKFNRRES
jgi:vacuolar-type H+-ATPase subunit F/Vma7